MIINKSNLSNLFIGYQAAFNKGFQGAESVWPKIAMKVSSQTSEENYGWLGQVPKMREWLGDRVVKNLMGHSYKIRNRDFEQTVGVPRNDIEDDTYGIFAPFMEDMGRSASEMPDELIFSLLKDGFTTRCYDGQYFFDTDHPVGDPGVEVSVSNSGGGSGAAWFLLDTSRPMKPMIYQERRPLGTLVSKTEPTDDNVFHKKEFLYGSDGRCNVGFGLWQMAYGSKQTLDATSYKAARKAMMEMKGETERLLGIKPTLLVVPPSLEEAGLTLLNADELAGGGSNPWKGTAELLVTPWVA